MLLLPLLFCCALQRSCGAAGDTNPRGRPEDRTWLLACGPCWLCLMSLGPIGIVIKACGSESGRNGAAVAAVCRTESSHFTAGGGVGREGADGGGGGSGGGISPAFTMQALLECSAALLARLRAQPALLEGFVTLLALPA